MTKHESRTYKSWFAVTKSLAVIALTLIMASMLAPGAWGQYKILYNFTGAADGSTPFSSLILDTSGNLYGTTTAGGASGNGNVFKLTKNSDGTWTESVLYSFAGGTDGATPYVGVTFDASSNLYGTTRYGGSSSAGTVFQLVPNSNGTWTESVLYSFTGGSDGANPSAGVIFDASGTLYGMTYGGGTQGMGIVYKLTPNSNGSWRYGALHSFTGGTDGSYPLWGNLTFDTAGNLYGATTDGVDPWGGCPNGNDCGTIFELTPNPDESWNEKAIFRFDGSNAGTERKPWGTLIFDSAGHLYGATGGGGGWYGSVFELTTGATGDWTVSVLDVFQGNQDGAYPQGGVVLDRAGNLYGTEVWGCWNGFGLCGMVFELSPGPQGWTKSTPHWFTKGTPNDGTGPAAGVVLDTAGNVYGTTTSGGTSGYGVVFEFVPGAAQTFTTLANFDGTNGSDPHYGYPVQGIDGDFYGMTGGGGIGCGTVFKMTPPGALATLYNFQGASDGCNPDGGLMLATSGDIYGSTTNAGNSGGGTLFRVSPSGTLTTAHEFNYTDGGNTNSALAEAPDGIFYGTTVNGGHSISCCDGGGVIFQMTPAGAYSVLHFFDFSDGWDPQDATLIEATDGSFYGETAGGGSSSNCSNGCGTIFKVGPLGVYAVLHSFVGTDGYAPLGGLIQATDGNFYGTTYYGGAYDNGTVFRISAQGAHTTLHSFNGTDGAHPRGRLVQATDGKFYGTTYGGGANGEGTVFEITVGGKLTTLHAFDGTDGSEINSGLSQGTNGTFYGITSGGGTSGDGTIFSLSTGLGPFVAFILNSGAVGQTAEILGQGFTGTTAVSFNGTPAVFKVQSDTYLTATVPVGATTGSLTLTEPSGTLKSNQEFRVTPQIKSFSPTGGPVGTTIVIIGESFTQAMGAELACKWPMNFTVDSDTQITATIPPNGTSGGIMVFTPGGHVETTAKFSVTP
ncbi:MAG: choice-of-anchor tandem repeat GloVer-containing protein [Candidatus Sulfotelmatobacter sp.]